MDHSLEREVGHSHNAGQVLVDNAVGNGFTFRPHQVSWYWAFGIMHRTFCYGQQKTEMRGQRSQAPQCLALLKMGCKLLNLFSHLFLLR